MEILVQCIFAFCAIIAFSLVIETPKKCLAVNGTLGAVGWAVYLLVLQYADVIQATFISALVLAALSHILARVIKVPVITLLIPAILTIVPGAGMYQTVYDILKSSVDSALYSLFSTLGAAGAIAFAIFIVDAVVAASRRGIRQKKALMHEILLRKRWEDTKMH